MLKSLYIQNYALIDTLNIQFEPGFSVITGETGAGKSIILGAIGLLLGQRADSKSIKSGASKCTIEAVFDLSKYEMRDFFERNDLDYDAGECVIRREISISGKSRAFINDTPVGVALLKELGEKLLDVHSQHQNLLLNKEDFQLNVTDIIASDKQELQAYQQIFNAYRDAEKQLREAQAEAERNRADQDYIAFQLKQLETAQLTSGEQEELEHESDTLEHAEEIKHTLFQVDGMMQQEDGGIVHVIRECKNLLNGISQVYTPADELAERLESCYIEIKDIAGEVSDAAERIEFNPERQAFVEERLNTIYTLQQKHGVTSVEELLAIQEKYQNQLDKINNSDEMLEALTAEKERLYKELVKQADILTEKRTAAARLIEEEMQKKLAPLGIPNVRFKVDMQKKNEPDASGRDKICFLFSANKNGELQQVAQVASGGEIARVMLSLKAMISGAVKLPTIIFDEIDTGVSGNIAGKMAQIMKDMGTHNRQVISITHLPQIAAMGSHHYKVYKEDHENGTSSHIVKLTEDERVMEIAHMLSGTVLTEAAINNARELLRVESY